MKNHPLSLWLLGGALCLSLSACQSAPKPMPAPPVTPEPPLAAQEEVRFREDLGLLCKAHRLPEMLEASPDMLQARLALHLAKNFRTTRALDLLTELTTMAPRLRVQKVRVLMAEQQLPQCPILDEMWDTQTSGVDLAQVVGTGLQTPRETRLDMRHVSIELGSKWQPRSVERMRGRWQHGLQKCHEKYAAGVALDGMLHIAFVIDKDGKVQKLTTKLSNLGQDLVQDCLLKKIENTRFQPRFDHTDPTKSPFARVTVKFMIQNKPL